MRGILPSKLGERTDLPPIPEFSGVDQTPGNNSFQQWLEQFEMVAELAQWPETISSWPYMYVFEDLPRHIFVYAVKNRNTTTNLCMVQAMSQRFTPVRIQALECSTFHERKQGRKKPVDTYAQELQRLFQRAYPNAVYMGTQMHRRCARLC